MDDTKRVQQLREWANGLNPLDPRRREIAEALVLSKSLDPPTPPFTDAHYTDAAQLRTWRKERG